MSDAITGPAVMERFLDHDGRILPPGGRHHDPVDLAHQTRQIGTLVGTDEPHATAGGLDQPADLLGVAVGMGAAAMNVEQAVLAPGVRRHAGNRLEQHVHALERVEPAEEGEAIASPMRRGRTGRRRALRRETVLDHMQPLAGQAPGDVPVGEKP